MISSPAVHAAVLFGMPVVIVPNQARYVLPNEVLPGVPWPEGFKAELDAWAAAFFKPVNPLDALGVQYFIREHRVHVSPKGLVRLKAAFADSEGGEP